ncbi:MAG: hypothetical protein QOG16_275, partial [Actinomycetota bacterium]|nr:hypothetical protein [Actinomycetota bacterium]
MFLAVAMVASSLMPAQASARSTGTNRTDLIYPPSGVRARAQGRVPGEVIVRYRSSADGAERSALRAQVDGDLLEKLELSRTEVIDVGSGAVDGTIAALEASPEVAFAEPNYYVHAASVIPNDPRFSQQWGLDNTGQNVSGATGTADADVDAPEAWSVSTGSKNTVVAIIDTGIAYDHPDLAPNLWTNAGEVGGGKETNGVDDDGNSFEDDWRGWDFVDKDNSPRDLVGHGTHVAGTVGAAGNDGYGATGIAWRVHLMALRVLDEEGSGTTSDVASAVAYAADEGADVINLSLSGPDFSLSVSNAIASATDSLVVVAAGNEGSNNDVTPSYPCNYPAANLVCVAASDQNDALAGFSNYGAVNVDLTAPGTRILSTVPSFTRALRETFEADISSTWTTGGTGTRWGRSLDSLGYFAADSPDGNYQANTNSWLKTATPVDLSNQQNCRLVYAFSLDSENNADFLTVEASTDGTNWTSVGGWTGSTGKDWLSASHDLGDFDGSSVYIRFRMTSNALVNRDGASIDQVEVRCLATSYTGSEFTYYSGTSMATPLVSGVAALVYSSAPDSTVAEVRSALMAGVDPVAGLASKVFSGGRLNAATTLDIVAPLPGSSPSPSESSSPSPSASTSPSPDP